MKQKGSTGMKKQQNGDVEKHLYFHFPVLKFVFQFQMIISPFNYIILFKKIEIK